MSSETGNIYKTLLILMALAVLLLSGFRLGALPFIPSAPYSDAALSHWQAAHYLRESVLGEGVFPLWRDGIMGSQPFAANPLNKTAYPLQWLALIFPAAVHLGFMVVLHGLIAGWGMWRWARRLGQREAAAAVAALGYVLGPRLLAHTGAGHLDLLYALAWWPWLMAALSAVPFLRTAALAFLTGGAALSVLVWLVLGRKLDTRTAGPLLLLVVFADVGLTGLRWLSWRGPDDWLYPGDAVAYALADDNAGRVYAPYVQLDDGQIVTALPQPAAAAYRLSQFGGVDPFQLAGFVDAIAQATGADSAGYDVVLPPILSTSALSQLDPAVLARWGVTHIASPVALDVGWMPLGEVGSAYLYRVAGPPGPLNRLRWPDDWAGLPDARTVERLNGLTVGAWAFSMASFVGCLALLALLERRRSRV